MLRSRKTPIIWFIVILIFGILYFIGTRFFSYNSVEKFDGSSNKYPTIKFIKTVDLTREIFYPILGEQIKLYSGTPSIVELKDGEYLVNMRWINTTISEDGKQIKTRPQFISMNSRFKMDKQLKQKGKEIFLEEDFEKEKHFPGTGLEDIRIFNYKNNYYYIATYYDDYHKTTSMSSGKYNILDNNYRLDRNIILPSFNDLGKPKKIDKNWSLFDYNNQLRVVYQWFPMKIGEIDYDKNQMRIIETKENMPEAFKDARGSTCGYTTTQNEIWFVLHKTIYNPDGTRIYTHFFAIFDTNMNLLRYSEEFTFDGKPVEFCIGLIVSDSEVILSYSLLDTQSKISVYSRPSLESQLEWTLV